ncbi:MAG TPA: hypothetical protein VGC34_05020 [Steroidobacteraceae bacterium]
MKAKMLSAAVGIRLAICAVGCLVVAMAAAAADEPADAGPKAITVDATAQARFGVSMATLKGAAAPAGTATTARVLDPGPLLKSDSELAAAAASFAASRAEALRARKLFSENRTVSARVVEAATAQEQADLQRVNAAHRELALGWGGGVANLQAHRRAELLNDLAGTKAELVRVEVPTGSPIPRAGSSIEVRGNSASEVFSGTVLGTLPTADPRLQTRGVLVELKGDAAKLPIGQMLSAEVPTADAAGVDGVILPRAALLRRDARVWVYVQTEATVFVRREVRDARPMLSGWFVAKGFAPGDRVVASGAAALLGIESPAAADADTD